MNFEWYDKVHNVVITVWMGFPLIGTIIQRKKIPHVVRAQLYQLSLVSTYIVA